MFKRLFLYIFSALIVILVAYFSIVSYSTYRSNHSTPLPKPTPANPDNYVSKQGRKEKPFIVKDNNLLLKDPFYGFQLNINRLPQLKIPSEWHYSDDYYELEMYEKVTNEIPELGERSVARLQILFPTDNSLKTSLENYAKEKFHYVEGKHDPINDYEPQRSTPLIATTLASGIKEISWSDIYTDKPTYQEGVTAHKHYLLSANNKIFAFEVMAWDMPTFNKATAAFDKVIASFQTLP